MRKQTLLQSALLLILLGITPYAHSAPHQNAIEAAQATAESQVRRLIEPLLDKYCKDECRLMAVDATVDIAMPDEVAPGFDDIDPRSAMTLAPSSARIKLLIDEKVGPVSRGKLLDLIQQYLDTLDFPVKVDVQTTHFPQPVGSAAKVADLRERITRQFRKTIDELFLQFCPEQCMLADYELQTDLVNAEEAQYGSGGEFVEDGGVAVRIRNISGTILVDESLTKEEQNNVLEMAKLRTNYFKNVTLGLRAMKFPQPKKKKGEGDDEGLAGKEKDMNRSLASEEKKASEETKTIQNSTQTTTDAKSAESSTEKTNETTSKQERYERIEKIERVENGDAVQKELQKFKVYGLIFGCSILSLLIFMAIASYRPKGTPGGGVQRIIQQLVADPTSNNAPSTYSGPSAPDPVTNTDRNALIGKRYEIERLKDELMEIFAKQPKVAKQVFTRILTEEGVETTAQYIHIFGESVVMDMLRDPSLQADMNELMEFYAKNPFELEDDEKLELLRKLHNRTVAGKLVVMGSRSSNLFDFLVDMDGLQILELIRNESMTVKSIILTQCDAQKRAAVYSQLDEDSRMQLLTELSRIDYLPRDYIFNVANALKRKRRENPKLNTEALPGSDVLLTLLERTGQLMQRTVMKSLELNNPETARMIKAKLVSLDTLRHLRDGQLLEVVLSLRHDELLQFLKGAPEDIRTSIFAKSPRDLVAEIEEELQQVSTLSREAYQAVERKIINRMKLMANEGLINLVETNDRMLAETQNTNPGFVEAGPAPSDGKTQTLTGIKKVGGW